MLKDELSLSQTQLPYFVFATKHQSFARRRLVCQTLNALPEEEENRRAVTMMTRGSAEVNERTDRRGTTTTGKCKLRNVMFHVVGRVGEKMREGEKGEGDC